MIHQETLPDMKADVKARLQQIASLCDDLSMTLESEPDVVHAYLARQAKNIYLSAAEWAESKARRARR